MQAGATMFHHVFRVPRGELLFTHHDEARWLWRFLLDTFPELVALCLMPDHGHVELPHDDPDSRLGACLRGYARWRNTRTGRTGAVFERLPEPEPILDDQKADTVRRYIELNPCRAKLTDDPMAWPWSTARDALGFSTDSARRVPGPERYATWLANDQYVRAAAAFLPSIQFRDFTAADVIDGVCGLFRASVPSASTRGPLRTLVARTAVAHGVPLAELGDALHADRSSLRRLAAGTPTRGRRIADPLLEACVRVVGDPRFCALPTRDLRVRPGWLARLPPLG
jgi:hypothetical protein